MLHGGQGLTIECYGVPFSIRCRLLRQDCPYSEVLSQKVTYLFCNELDIVSKELRSRVRQATKDVVKSEV